MENVSMQTEKRLFKDTRDMVLTSVLVALVFIFTRFINIRLPISINGGLIHMGNFMLFISAIYFGKKKGAIAGAFGMAIFDILSGWMLWAPFTFVVRGVMGYIVGAIAETKQGKSVFMNTAAIAAGGLWMIGGYYITEVILYKNWIAPVTSIPGNITQIVIGLVSALPVIAYLNRSNIKSMMMK